MASRVLLLLAEIALCSRMAVEAATFDPSRARRWLLDLGKARATLARVLA